MTHRADDPRVRSVAQYQKDLFVHHFRVESLAQLDAELVQWIADAYDHVGCGNR